MTAQTIRAAVAQFHVSEHVDANLASCLRALDAAAAHRPDVVVLPEFANHLSWYSDIDHCRDVSVDIDGDFMKAIAGKARDIDSHLVVNATVRRGPDRRATGTSVLFDREGRMMGQNDKQVLIGHENDFLDRASANGPIIDSALGPVGLYACMDGVINETPRSLALRGGKLLLNSLNSFASDEASLHIPVRAAENKVFVAAANKIGPLIPENLVAIVSEQTGIPERFLDGAGESQIVGPDGEALVMASLDKEEVVVAEIDLSAADDKTRPDGTNIFSARRPELYSPLAADPATQTGSPFAGASSVEAALIAPGKSLNDLIDAYNEAAGQGARLVAAPPLFGLDGEPPAEAAARSADAIATIAAACRDAGAWLATSLVMPDGDGFQHVAVLIGPDGLALKQPQIHRSERCAWSRLGDRVETVDLPFGRVALVTSDDSIYPEHFRLVALTGAEIAIVPLAPLERWELKTGLIERAAENRVNLLAACEPGPLGNGLAACLQTDFTVLTPWAERAFDGLLSQPELVHAAADARVTMAGLRPANAANKVVSRGTDLLAGRPWMLADALVAR